ncbi:MAG: helix-turn-helix transcriptional regulator [Candidatus Parcubacteria bacterium]|nr:helix-turn-helix transcriptional regulator [Candidatus Parcubacteria bacterium]
MDITFIGEKIKKLREIKGLTQKELGAKLGYSESLISYIEKGQRSIRLDDLRKISDIFSIDYNYFLGGPYNPTLSNFSAEVKSDDNINYDNVINEFLSYAKNK